MRVLGLMSGTSVDAVDAAVADFSIDGDVLVLHRVGELTLPWPSVLRERVVAAIAFSSAAAPASSSHVSVRDLCRLDRDLGITLGELAATAIADLSPEGVDLVASHGQTLHHAVGTDGQVEGTWQIGQPAEIAEWVGAPVVADLRVRDVAAGGQGAPLVAILDELLLAGSGEVVAALNLGGIANVTVVSPAAATSAFDVGPANALLDLAVQQATGKSCDRDGALTSRGSVDGRLLDVLLADPFLAQPPPKSTGKERYHADYLAAALEQAPVAGLEDVLATLAEATACAVSSALRSLEVSRVWVSGGGLHNTGLMAALARRLGDAEIGLAPSDELGLPVDHKEAYAFALLGWLTWHGLPGNLPTCTGANGPRVLGTLVPGPGPLQLPSPLSSTPVRVSVRR